MYATRVDFASELEAGSREVVLVAETLYKENCECLRRSIKLAEPSFHLDDVPQQRKCRPVVAKQTGTPLRETAFTLPLIIRQDSIACRDIQEAQFTCKFSSLSRDGQVSVTRSSALSHIRSPPLALPEILLLWYLCDRLQRTTIPENHAWRPGL